ncbi:TetR family transcriptional regulator [Streptomyces inusitatus]|uniref:TetR family transcriptional regulator n=1 Tax=Streptomyces inusitatus TaxID=68221 RepID=A0A918QE78_9ACTN|nr:TetR/AcrR family transcriptional regulator [Streptomyces inusitatus]GGZ42932.1 TetR family transcriptional regulator [Streptomyces inusitatus]
MPTARESLLSAAHAALAETPWSGVRMVDVAAAAGLSRQTLYNEFGSKDGLARALVRCEADAYLQGVDRLLDQWSGTVDPLVAVAEWTVGEATAKPLLKALLTGCWGERLPAPKPVLSGTPPAGVPAQRRADAGLPVPSEVVALVRDRSVAALEQGRCAGGDPNDPGDSGEPGEGAPDLAHRCELAVRLALSCVIAPAGHGVGPLVRTVVGDLRLSGPTPTAEDR